MLFDFQIQPRYKKATGYLPFLFEGSSPGSGVWISENTPHPQQANLMSTLWDKIIKGKRFWSRLETDQVSRRHLSIFVTVYYDWLRSEHLGSMAINTFQHNNNNKIIIFNFYLQFYFWDELIDCLWKIRVLEELYKLQSGTLDTCCVCINASKSWKKKILWGQE